MKNKIAEAFNKAVEFGKKRPLTAAGAVLGLLTIAPGGFPFILTTAVTTGLGYAADKALKKKNGPQQ